jgi:hypothetical protein
VHLVDERLTKPYFAETKPDSPINPDPDFFTIQDAFTPDESEQWARELERLVHEDPKRRGRILDTLGDTVTSRSVEAFLDVDLSPEDMEDATVMLVYFSGRCDQEVVYDDATEKALRADPEFREAVQKLRNAPPRMYRTGEMSTKMRAHPDAKKFRDNARRVSLTFFISQVALAQQESLRQAS